MSASENQSSLNQAQGAGATWGPGDTKDSSEATPGMSVGSATAMGHGEHPTGDKDDRNATIAGSKVGPQNEDLEGEQMRAAGEGDIYRAQFNKTGQGEERSLTSGLDRQKAEQQSSRESVKAERRGGGSVDGGVSSLNRFIKFVSLQGFCSVGLLTPARMPLSP